jgi:RimJ/RimL family protein N-acetyltransferase
MSEQINWCPTLEGKTILLRPLVKMDFDSLYVAASDPEIWRLHPNSDRWQKPAFNEYFTKGTTEHQALAVIDRQTNQIIGSSRFYDPTPHEVTIGFTFLSRPYWGGATNRELKLLMLNYAFQYVERALFVIGVNNLRSRRAMEKLGARLTAEPSEDASRVVYEIRRGGN